MKFASLAVCGVLLIAPPSSFAADRVELTPQFGECVAKSDGGDFSALECQGAEFTRQDKRLNEAYRKTLARLPKAKAEELRKVQRAWFAFVEAKCGFLYDNHEFSGTLDRVAASYCGVEERARRAAELEQLLP